MENWKSFLQIRYIKLRFIIAFTDDCRVPQTKTSALRGGMGQMLLQSYCIGDEACDACEFQEECLVRRMMYPKMPIRPAFMQTRDAEGYIVECDDWRTFMEEGDRMEFNLILFGNSLVYFTLFLNAFYMLGQAGLGKEHARFNILSVTNMYGKKVVNGIQVYKKNYKPEILADYVRFRMRELGFADSVRMSVCTTLMIKHEKKIQKEFASEALMKALWRRIYIMNCYEGIGREAYEEPVIEEHLPIISAQYVKKSFQRRYSSAQNSHMSWNGISGWCDLTEIDETALAILIAGEILHVGKETSFGFGQYRLK